MTLERDALEAMFGVGVLDEVVVVPLEMLRQLVDLLATSNDKKAGMSVAAAQARSRQRRREAATTGP